jgi:hypothetical protein
MKEHCYNCTEYSSCTKICPELEKSLEPKPKPIRRQKAPKNSMEQEDSNEIALDGNFQVDPGKQYEDVEPQEIDFFQTIVAPRSIGLSEKELKIIRIYIDKAIPSNKHKLKRRFLAFLRCDTMVKIAKRAGVSSQNIHKQFKKITYNIHKKMGGYKDRPKVSITPYQFKCKISE